jgi:hypothetical protein
VEKKTALAREPKLNEERHLTHGPREASGRFAPLFATPYTACAAGTLAERLICNTITAATRHKPPDIIDATV